MDLGQVQHIFRERFGISSDFVAGKQYAVRFTHLEMGRSVEVMAHHRGRLLLAPFHIKHLVAKFNLDMKEVMEAASGADAHGSTRRKPPTNEP